MLTAITLADFLRDCAGTTLRGQAVARCVEQIAAVSLGVSDLIAEGELLGSLDSAVGKNVDGDTQKALDVQANDRFIEALTGGPVGVLGSEESEEAVVLGEGQLALTLDPLDGSSNIATNVSVGSIFSVYPRIADAPAAQSVLQPGARQLAAGFVIYGPQTTLALTLGTGTVVFTLSRKTRSYWLTQEKVQVPESKAEYAVNGSNARHWREPVSRFIESCQAGKEGPYGENYNTRWVASLVAEAYRIFSRGGVFLYPADARQGYENGRLRLVYEANAIALLMEQAGGQATDGVSRILDLQPAELHQRTPLVFGSSQQVTLVKQAHASTESSCG